VHDRDGAMSRVLIAAATVAPCAGGVTASASLRARHELSAPVTVLAPLGADTSQYSPDIVRQQGSTLMYYCRNSPNGQGVYRDRVWRAEQRDGTATWATQPVIDGQDDTNLDLVCSPGVVIDGSNQWHLYFIAANRNTPVQDYLYVATAQAPGITWSAPQLVSGIPQGTGFLDTPAPLWLDGRIVLYYLGNDQRLWRAASREGVTFGTPEQVATANAMSGARVTFANNIFYLVSSRSPVDVYLPPDELDSATSSDGLHFSAQTVLLSSPGDPRLFTPFAVINGTTLTLFYASSMGNYQYWETNTSILMATTSVPPTHTLSVSVMGKGRVTSAPPGITCPTTCTATFAGDTAAKLAAAPAFGYRLARWSGACSGKGTCALTISTDANVTATFTRIPVCKNGQRSTKTHPCRSKR
jgi:Divergent InlB B-repeat domain